MKEIISGQDYHIFLHALIAKLPDFISKFGAESFQNTPVDRTTFESRFQRWVQNFISK